MFFERLFKYKTREGEIYTEPPTRFYRSLERLFGFNFAYGLALFASKLDDIPWRIKQWIIKQIKPKEFKINALTHHIGTIQSKTDDGWKTLMKRIGTKHLGSAHTEKYGHDRGVRGSKIHNLISKRNKKRK